MSAVITLGEGFAAIAVDVGGIAVMEPIGSPNRCPIEKGTLVYLHNRDKPHWTNEPFESAVRRWQHALSESAPREGFYR